VLTAALGWGVLATAITELLSVFYALSFTPLLISWLTASVGLLIAGAIFPSSNRPQSWIKRLSELGRERRAEFIAVAVLVASLGIIGVCSAPANSDSMAYHLPRVMHWMEHHSVRHYATGNVTQLYHGPGAEFAMLHFQILTDGDRFASSVQWMAMLVCLVGVYVLTGQIAGAATKAQWLAVVFTIAIPNTVLQAVSTQNNLVVSAWLVVSAVMLLSFRQCLKSCAGESGKNLKQPLILAIGFGSAIGLALLTKGTAYLYVLPLIVWFVAINIRHAKRFGVPLILVAGSMAIALNVCHWVRNFRWCGSPLMPADQAQIFHTQHIGPRLIAANAINNVALELRTGMPWLDRPTSRAAAALQSALGTTATDPRISLFGHSLDVLAVRGINEDVAGNPLHFLIVAGVLGIVLVRAVQPGQRADILILALIVFSGFALFCFLIRWQMFHCRLHLPLMILSAPIVAITCTRICKLRHVRAAAWSLLVLAACTIVANAGHPLFGSRSIFITSRESQYFTIRPRLYEPYKNATDILARRGCRNIGITSGPVWEYPLWVMLHTREGRWPHIQSVTPDQPLPDGAAPDPNTFCAVIALPRRHGSDDSYPPPLGWPTRQMGNGVQLLLKP